MGSRTASVKRTPVSCAKASPDTRVPRRRDGRLILPLYSADGALSSLQYIDSAGTKMYHPGGAVGGCFFMLGDASGSETIYIAEGFATAATICEEMHAPTVASYSANNLPAVTGLLRKRYPAAELVIVADNDKSKTGENYASQASAKHGARVILIPNEGQDANDYLLAGNDLKGFLSPSVSSWLISDEELCSQPSPIKWLIKGWIQDNALIMAHGPSGGWENVRCIRLGSFYCLFGYLGEEKKFQVDLLLIWQVRGILVFADV